MAQHWYEKAAEVLIGKFRRAVTTAANRTADYAIERVPAIPALYEQVGSDTATDVLNIIVEILPDPDTRTLGGKVLELAKDFVERFIFRLQEGLGGEGAVRGGVAAGAAVPADKRGNMFHLLDAAVVAERRGEFLGFMKILTPRQRRAVVEFILDRELAERQAFLALPLEERMRFIWLLIPQTKSSEIERLESEIRVRWTYSERLFTEAAVFFAEADAIRPTNRAAAMVKDICGEEKEEEAQQLVASLNDLQAELLRLSRASSAAPAVPTTLNNALQRIRAWDQKFAPKKREPKEG